MHINCGNVGVIPFCTRIHGTLMPVSPSLLTPSPSPVPPVSFLAHSCSHSDVFSIQGPKWLMRSPSLMTQVQTSSPWGQDWLPQVFLWFSHICMTCTLIHDRKKEGGDKRGGSIQYSFQSGLFDLTQWSLVLFIFPQMAISCSSYWSNNTLLYTYTSFSWSIHLWIGT